MKDKLYVVILIIVIFIAIFVSKNIAILFINGESMSPTYHDEQVVILKKAKTLKDNQIVVFDPSKSWHKEDTKFIKRIIASPGDTVLFSNEEISVNGVSRSIEEKNCELENEIKIVMRDEQYLVAGDNTANSNDSITQFCSGNEDFSINKNQIILSGKEWKVLGGNK